MDEPQFVCVFPAWLERLAVWADTDWWFLRAKSATASRAAP